MMAETKTRLRASCNACNESKVRCSQDKPTCTRCERNQAECIYGLSRRTHKDAPPLFVPTSQRARKPPKPTTTSRQLPGATASATPSTNSNSPSMASYTPDSSQIFTSQLERQNDEAHALHSYKFSTATDMSAMDGVLQPVDFSNLLDSSVCNTNTTTDYFSSAQPDYTNLTNENLESFFESNHNNNTMEIGMCHNPNFEDECACHAGVTQLLLTTQSGDDNFAQNGINDRRTSIDTRLAKLRQCIASSEISIRCTHKHEDSEPTHIMAVAMLIGYAIDSFKTIISDFPRRVSVSSSSSSSSSSSMVSLPSSAAAVANRQFSQSTGARHMCRVATTSSTNMNPESFIEPRLSWGMLELEEEDEMDLRYRLCLLSFRKLDRLLSELRVYTQDLHNSLISLPDPSRHMDFVIVCDYTRLWLEKKAADVGKLFSISTRMEMMESMF